jgi:hypothetical protein
MWNCIRELQVLEYSTPDTLRLMLHLIISNMKYKAQKY